MYLEKEWMTICNFLHEIKKVITIGSYKKETENNKLIDIFLAQLVKINTPITLVTTNKEDYY
jgi:hypothetical protein